MAFYNIWEEILTFKQVLSFSIQHTYKQSNFVADQLVKEGVVGVSTTYSLASQLLPLALGEYKMDVLR